MKRLHVALIVLIIFFIVFLMSGCDDGLLIVDMKISHYPDTIIYIAGIDTELDFAGGMVSIITKDEWSSSNEPFSRVHEIIEDVDFNTPGVYSVTLRHGKFENTFTVQVIGQEELQNLLEKVSKTRND